MDQDVARRRGGAPIAGVKGLEAVQPGRSGLTEEAVPGIGAEADDAAQVGIGKAVAHAAGKATDRCTPGPDGVVGIIACPEAEDEEHRRPAGRTGDGLGLQGKGGRGGFGGVGCVGRS